MGRTPSRPLSLLSLPVLLGGQAPIRIKILAWGHEKLWEHLKMHLGTGTLELFALSSGTGRGPGLAGRKRLTVSSASKVAHISRDSHLPTPQEVPSLSPSFMDSWSQCVPALLVGVL